MTDLIDEAASTTGSPRRPRRRWLWIAAAAVVGVVVFVLFWFQPQKLFIDDLVDEAISAGGPSPVGGPSSAPTGRSATTVPVPNEPAELGRGEFVSLDHSTSGVARVLEFADGRRIVRIEGLDTDNGPDLYLYLSSGRADGDEGAFDDEFLDLGRLKGNKGDQNYDVPTDADLNRFATVVIWCDRFNSAFGAADLVT